VTSTILNECFMHKFKSRSAKNVIGLKLSGTLSSAEYHEIVPYLEEKIKEYGKIRLLIELDHWEGWGAYAAFNDMFFVLKNSFKIERVAFLLKSEADKRAVLLAKPFSPWARDTTRYFGPEESEAAWDWVGEGIADFTIPSDEDFDLKEKERKKKVRYGPKQNILIIGGGVSGMAMAALLQQRGFEPSVVYMQEESSEGDRAIQIWPTAGGILKSLRLYKKTLKASAITSFFDIYNVKGVFLHRYDNSVFELPYGPIMMVARNKLIKILHKFLASNVIRNAVAVTKLKATQDGVKITFSDGKKEIFDCVICIDGLNSKMRELIFGMEPIPVKGKTGWFFSVKPNTDFPEGVTTYCGKRACMKLCKIGEKVFGFASVKKEGPQKQADDNGLELFKDTFQDFPTIVKSVVDLVEKGSILQFNGLYQNYPDNFDEVRIAFLEEAAFSYRPSDLLAETLALEAAGFLSEQLSRSDSVNVVRTLKKYQQYRQHRKESLGKHLKQKDLQLLFCPEDLENVDDFSKEFVSDKSYEAFWKTLMEE